MEIFLVGGAVRDELLNLAITEHDYVVVGATPQEMLAQGYQQVGKDFPVFLHPKTREEYALARTERKSSRGYTGFTVYADPSVTLEEDLKRRDLTINAIAKDANGNLIDPFNGKRDIEQKILRHVSPAFVEDPLRILRVARFAARFAELGFTVAPETMVLMQEIVKQGEIEHLVAERVWLELEKTLAEKSANTFFVVLRECGALERLFPELVNDDKEHFEQALHNLKQTSPYSLQTKLRPCSFFSRKREKAAKSWMGTSLLDKTVRFAVFLYPFVANSKDDEFVTHFCEKYRVPNDYKTTIFLIVRANSDFIKFFEKHDAESLLVFLEKIDAFRRPKHLELFLQAADILNAKSDPAAIKLIEKCFIAAKGINTEEIKTLSLTGLEIQQWIQKKRLEAIRKSL